MFSLLLRLFLMLLSVLGVVIHRSAQSQTPSLCISDTDPTCLKSGLEPDSGVISLESVTMNSDADVFLVDKGNFSLSGLAADGTRATVTTSIPSSTKIDNNVFKFSTDVAQGGSLKVSDLNIEHQGTGRVFLAGAVRALNGYHLSLERLNINVTADPASLFNDFIYISASGTETTSIHMEDVKLTGTAESIINASGVSSSKPLRVEVINSDLTGQQGIKGDRLDILVENSIISTSANKDAIYWGYKTAAHIKNSVVNGFSNALYVKSGFSDGFNSDKWDLMVTDKSVITGYNDGNDAQIGRSYGVIDVWSQNDALVQDSQVIAVNNTINNLAVFFVARGGVARIEGSQLINQRVGHGLVVNRDTVSDSKSSAVVTYYLDPLTQEKVYSKIETQSQKGRGIYVSMLGKVSVDHTDIVTRGNEAEGIFVIPVTEDNALSGNLEVGDNTSITTYGDQSAGILTEYGNSISLKGASVHTYGEASTGVSLNDSKLSIVERLMIVTEGDQATGLVLNKSPLAKLENIAIMTKGVGADGVQISNSVVNNALWLNRTQIEALNQSNAIQFGKNGNVNLTLTGSQIVSGSSLANLSISDTELGVAINTGAEFNGHLEVLLDGQSQLYGDINLQAGTGNLSLTNQSVWAGTALLSAEGRKLDRVTIDATSSWYVKNTSYVGELINRGSVIINQPTQTGENYKPEDYYKLVVQGDYVSEGGVLLLNQELNERELGDFFFVEGTVTGTTKLVINPTERSGTPTSGRGILMVYAGPDSSNVGGYAAMNRAVPLLNQSLFVLEGGSLNAGAYTYQLVYHEEENGLSAGWYLSSECITPDCLEPPVGPEPEPNPEPTPEPEPEPTPEPIPEPEPEPIPKPIPALQNYRNLAVTASVVPALTSMLTRESVAHKNERSTRVEHEGTHLSRWVNITRIDRGTNPLKGSAIGRRDEFLKTGASFDLTLSALKLGTDLYENQDSEGTQETAGVYLALLNGDSDVEQVYKSSMAGTVDAQSRGLGVYYHYKKADGLTLDVVAVANRLNHIEVNSFDKKDSFTTKGSSLVLSAEVMKTLDLSNRWFIEPQARLHYQRVNIKSGQNFQQFIADYERQNIVLTKMGVNIGYRYLLPSNEDLRISAKAHVWHYMKGHRSKTTIYGGQRAAETALNLPSQLDKTSVELGLAVSGAIDKNKSLDFSASYLKGLGARSTEGMSGTIKFNYSW